MKSKYRVRNGEGIAFPWKRHKSLKTLLTLAIFQWILPDIWSQMYSGKQVEILSLPYVRESIASSYSIFKESKLSLTEEEIVIYRELLELVELEDGPNLALKRLLPELKPDSSTPFYYFAGHLYSLEIDDDKAAEYFEETLKREPAFLNAIRAYSSLLIRKKQDYITAVPLLIRAIELSSNETSDYGFLGLAYLNLKQYSQAEEAYRMAIILDSSIMDWKIGLTQALISQRKYEDTITALLEILRDESENDQYWTLLANAYIGLDNPKMALATHLVIDGLGKSTTETLNLIGTISLLEGMTDMAADYYVRSVEKDSKGQLASAHLEAAQNMLSYGNFELSARLLTTIKTRMSEKLSDEQSLFSLRLESKIALASGDFEKSVPILKQLADHDSTDGESLLLLAEYYKGLGTDEGFGEAEDFYLKAREIEVFKVKAILGLAEAKVAQGDLKKALVLIEEAYSYEPSDYIADYLNKVRKVFMTMYE